MKRISLAVIVALAAALAAAAGESKYEATTNGSATVVFGPAGAFRVTGLHAAADSNAAHVLFYVRGATSARLAPVTNPAAGATVIAVANSGYQLTNADAVVYVHGSGALDWRTVASATPSNVTLSAAISEAGAAGDRIYEVTPAFRIHVGTTPLSEFGGHVFAVPGDSPLVVRLISGTNATLAVTTDR